jgi:hypothetical protein
MRIAAPDGSPDRKNVQDRSRQQMLKFLSATTVLTRLSVFFK